MRKRARYFNNPINSRGGLHDEKGTPIRAKAEGGPADGRMFHVQHPWLIAREPIEVEEGMFYTLATDSHGFVLAWAGRNGGVNGTG